MGSIIKVEHLSYVYNPGMPNAVTALDDVSFEVEEGDFVGIIGATGSGKSTHMNGLNKPTSGKIFIDGRDLWAEPEKIRDFRFLTGLVFQYPEYQLFEETCYKDIAFGPKNMGLDEAEIDHRVHEAASFVGLDEALLERSPFELSGGQKRRVAVKSRTTTRRPAPPCCWSPTAWRTSPSTPTGCWSCPTRRSRCTTPWSRSSPVRRSCSHWGCRCRR